MFVRYYIIRELFASIFCGVMCIVVMANALTSGFLDVLYVYFVIGLFEFALK